MLALIRSCEDAEQIHRWYAEAVAYKKVGTCTRGEGWDSRKEREGKFLFFFVGKFSDRCFLAGWNKQKSEIEM